MEETGEELPNFSILGPDPTRSKNKAEKHLQVAPFANLNLNLIIKITGRNIFLRQRFGVLMTPSSGQNNI